MHSTDASIECIRSQTTLLLQLAFLRGFTFLVEQPTLKQKLLC